MRKQLKEQEFRQGTSSQPLRVCFMGNFRSIHLQRWMQYFIQHHYDCHYLSYNKCSTSVAGLQMHSLIDEGSRMIQHYRRNGPGRDVSGALRGRIPLGLDVVAMGFKWLVHGIRTKIREIRPDVLHAHFLSEDGFYAALSGFSPLVVSAWGSDILIHPKQSVVSRCVLRYVLKRSTLVHSISRVTTDQLISMGVRPDRIVTLPFGVEESLLERQTTRGAGGDVVVSTRMFHEVYNIKTLIKAIDMLRHRCPDVLLKLTGDGPLRKDIEHLVAQLGLERHVAFLGFLPREDLFDVLCGADVYVSTSLSDGASVSLLEAMAIGLFPIVSDIPANRDWIEDGVSGFLVDAMDEQALAEKLRVALTQDSLKRQAARRNKEIIRTRALWNDHMKNMEAIYWHLVN